MSWLRFAHWEPRLFAGDDLFNYMFYHGDRFNGKWATLFFADSGQKFRFIFSGLFRSEAYIFGNDINGYLVVNIIAHAINGTLLCLIAYSLCRSWIVSVILSVIAVTSRFGLYEVTQATGQVESVALIFGLLSVLCVMKAASDETSSDWPANWKWAALSFAFLAFNTHERYLVLLPWLSIFFVFHRRAGTAKQRWAFIAVCGLLLVSNALVKHFVYHSNFFQGTGGTPLSINLRSICTLLSEATLSISGINHGPQYLIGAEWADFSALVRIASIVLFAATISLVIAAFLPRRSTDKTTQSIHWPMMLLTLIGLLLLPAVLTIRMEQRWELGPFFLVLLICAIGIGRVIVTKHGRAIVVVVLVCMCIGESIVELRVSKSFSVISYVYAGNYAEAVKLAAIDSKLSAPGAPLIFVTFEGNCVGTLLAGGFFVVYEGKYRSLQCVSSLEDLSDRDVSPDARIYASTHDKLVTDVTDQWRAGKGRK